MTEPLRKFQALLRELFQFDCADLDFGIYRIMNHKRDEIEAFIDHKLPNVIAEELDKGQLAEQSQAAAELKQVAAQVREALGADALAPDGTLASIYDHSPLGRKYLALRAKAAGASGQAALEAMIYNHLVAFFSRYYQDGDIISKRRYSKRERYAIPYNGEEVYLYWANHDQYYVKTGEYFTDYSFTSNGVTVAFKLQAADVEQDNVKGDKRFFVPLWGATVWDEGGRTLVIPFEYRPLTGQEEIAYGKRYQQEAIITKALVEIPGHLPKGAAAAHAALGAEWKKGERVTVLAHHLRQYTRRNTSDFFIHKDLAGFLTRELDFYLKNEVLSLDEVEAGGEARAEGWFQMLRAIKAVGGRIIAFLDQIESFQKMLWEKRKFVTETFYCITVGNIDETFYGEIAGCEAQWEEWRALYDIDAQEKSLFTVGRSLREKRVAFLKLHPTLVLDTRHFGGAFVDRLLGRFDDLDEMTGGLLIHSENWQALQLLLPTHRQQISCVHIDPPYNTQTSGFLYKNNYQHASWLSMMRDRITTGVSLLSYDGAFLCHIDENEHEVLHLLFDHVGIPDGGTIVWDKKNPMLGRRGIATQHEYVLWRSWDDASVYTRPTSAKMILGKAEELVRVNGGVSDAARQEFRAWIRACEQLTGGERAYQHIDDDGRVYRGVAMGAPEPRTDPKFHIPLVHPVTKKECPVPGNGWSRAPETLQDLIGKGEILFGEDETTQPTRKVFLNADRGRQISSVISDAGRGKSDLDQLGLEFPYGHPVSLYDDLLGAATFDGGETVLDHFAGSGSTGHSVINLNREDGGHRRFFLVEMADHFDTVLLPRIKKVTLTPEWKEGKPERLPTPEEAERSPRIVKVIRLESYEDALNNIAFDDGAGQQAMAFDDYLLRYMLKWETRGSETLLNVEKLAQPFSYTLQIHTDGQTREQVVDVPETFLYLLGLHVQARRVYDDGGRRYLVYRGRVDHRTVAVIWRETSGWEQADFERDRDFVAAQKFAEGADEVFVNGDSLIAGARALEPVFKARMFAPVEV